MVADVVFAYTAELVTRLTGLSFRQLTYWDRTGFFKPQFARFGEGKSAIRIYSFKDVVGLRTLQILKGTYRVSLQHLREVASTLSKFSKTPWSEIKLRVMDRQVYFDEPDTGKTRGVLNRQYVLLPLIDVMDDVRRRSADLATRTEDNFGKFERSRNVSHNLQVISGTRIPTKAIEAFLREGYSYKDILRQYPRLTLTDVEAVAQAASITKAA